MTKTGFSGLRLEPHLERPGVEIAVLYWQGKRIAVLYPRSEGFTFIFEDGVDARIRRRVPGALLFAEVDIKKIPKE